ncbi:MAG: protein kinase [Erysipelotrichaceae bacterium]|nr:protein kinase [Erysipelotrichaceae bacterium]MBR3355970.1 protein kinase [Oscillospiraceae bacterium]
MLEKYELVQSINNEHNVYLVKNIQDNSFYVKKELSIFDINVYNYLSKNTFFGIPFIKELIASNDKLIVIEEYIGGQSLERALKTGRVFSEFETKKIAIRICEILNQFDTEYSIVHRDIKPSNIIIRNDGELFIIDFNTAKFINENKAKDTVLLGTEGYAAPEQYGFASSSVQTDIYAIGVLMKELLTGTNMLNDYYASPLKSVITKCTRLDPSDRYQNFNELIEDLSKHSTTRLKDLIPVGYRSRKPWKMVLSSMWYLFILWFSFSLKVDNTYGVKLFIIRLGMAVALISSTLFAGNYQNIHDNIPKIQEVNKVLKVIIIAILSILVCLSILIFFLITVSL